MDPIVAVDNGDDRKTLIDSNESKIFFFISFIHFPPNSCIVSYFFKIIKMLVLMTMKLGTMTVLIGKRIQ